MDINKQKELIIEKDEILETDIESEIGDTEIDQHKIDLIDDIDSLYESEEDISFDSKVSEKKSEDKKDSGSAKTGYSKHDYSSLSGPPVPEVMIIQISTQIKKELSVLEKEKNAILRNPSKFSPFKLNEIIMKIRELKGILAELAYNTVDQIKQLWNKFVNNK